MKNSEQTETHCSLKGGSDLARQVARIQIEGRRAGRSEAAIQAEINAAVDKVYQQMERGTDFPHISTKEIQRIHSEPKEKTPKQPKRKFLKILLGIIIVVCVLLAGLFFFAATSGIRQGMYLSSLILVVVGMIPVSCVILAYRKWKKLK